MIQNKLKAKMVMVPYEPTKVFTKGNIFWSGDDMHIVTEHEETEQHQSIELPDEWKVVEPYLTIEEYPKTGDPFVYRIKDTDQWSFGECFPYVPNKDNTNIEVVDSEMIIVKVIVKPEAIELSIPTFEQIMANNGDCEITMTELATGYKVPEFNNGKVVMSL